MVFASAEVAQSKQQWILAAIRRAIQRGQFAPGSQLPHRSELERQFGVTRLTVQRAADRLKAEGTIYSRGRWGTFVSEHPPCLYRHGLVFPHRHRRDRTWSLAFDALRQAAERIAAETPYRFELFPDVYDDSDGTPASSHFARLQAALAQAELAGVIFGENPWPLGNSPLLLDGDTPRLALMSAANDDYPRLGAVAMDREDFLRQAMALLAARGCRRIAFLGLPFENTLELDQFRHLVAAHGLTTQPHWQHGVALSHAAWATHLAALLWHPDHATRPDGLVLTDDHLGPAVAAGLTSAGVRVPDDVQVVVLANLPCPAPPPLPFVRLGFDHRDVLRYALRWCAADRLGQPTERCHLVPPTRADA
jgi:DNA-binding LacI/PurR family transcriptional regulator